MPVHKTVYEREGRWINVSVYADRDDYRDYASIFLVWALPGRASGRPYSDLRSINIPRKVPGKYHFQWKLPCIRKVAAQSPSVRLELAIVDAIVNLEKVWTLYMDQTTEGKRQIEELETISNQFKRAILDSERNL